MEALKGEKKLPDMVMCGDHPSFTKSDLNVKEVKLEDKERCKEKEKAPVPFSRLSPSSSRTDRPPPACDGPPPPRPSDHTLRADLRRRVRSLEAVPRPEAEMAAPPNRALLQAALGSFRWPPYLLAVWVLVLVLTHLIHCLVSVLERGLPPLKKCCQYFRSWTESTWRAERDLNRRLCPILLAFITGCLYACYFGLYAVYAAALWAIEPLCSEVEERPSAAEISTRVTDYVDECALRVGGK